MKIIDIAALALEALDDVRLLKSLASEASLVVRDNTSAVEAARQAKVKNARVIYVTDDNGKVRGLVIPSSVRHKLKSNRNILSIDLEDALLQFERMPSERARNYHHEWLNSLRPVLEWCEIGEHYTDVLPCPFHS